MEKNCKTCNVLVPTARCVGCNEHTNWIGWQEGISIGNAIAEDIQVATREDREK